MKNIGKNKIGLGAGVLLFSALLCKALGAFLRLPLTNLLGIEGIGVFQLVMSLYSFALVLCSGGVANTLSKLISSSRANDGQGKINAYMKRAVILCTAIALGIGLVFLFCGSLISNFQGIEGNKSYWLFIILLPLGANIAVLRGYFQGNQNMTPTAISQVLEQCFKFAFGLLFASIFAKVGTAQGVLGAFVGITLSEVFALIYLFVLFMLKREKRVKTTDVFVARKEFDRAFFPLTLSASILPLMSAFDGLFIINRLTLSGLSSAAATQLFGLQSGVVGALLNFPLIISVSVSTALLPNLSYQVSRGSGGRWMIEKSLRALLFLILPTTFGMIAISKPLLAVVYPNLSPELISIAFELMFYGGFSIILTALMQFLTMLLQAFGQFRYILSITTIGGVAKAIISFTLSAVSSINIFALVLGGLVLHALVCVLALVRLKKLINFSINFSDVFFLLLSTLLMYFVVYFFLQCNYFSNLLSLVFSVFIGAAVYLILSAPVWNKFLQRKSKKRAEGV